MRRGQEGGLVAGGVEDGLGVSEEEGGLEVWEEERWGTEMRKPACTVYA